MFPRLFERLPTQPHVRLAGRQARQRHINHMRMHFMRGAQSSYASMHCVQTVPFRRATFILPMANNQQPTANSQPHARLANPRVLLYRASHAIACSASCHQCYQPGGHTDGCRTPLQSQLSPSLTRPTKPRRHAATVCSEMPGNAVNSTDTNTSDTRHTLNQAAECTPTSQICCKVTHTLTHPTSRLAAKMQRGSHTGQGEGAGRAACTCLVRSNLNSMLSSTGPNSHRTTQASLYNTLSAPNLYKKRPGGSYTVPT